MGDIAGAVRRLNACYGNEQLRLLAGMMLPFLLVGAAAGAMEAASAGLRAAAIAGAHIQTAGISGASSSVRESAASPSARVAGVEYAVMASGIGQDFVPIAAHLGQHLSERAPQVEIVPSRQAPLIGAASQPLRAALPLAASDNAPLSLKRSALREAARQAPAAVASGVQRLALRGADMSVLAIVPSRPAAELVSGSAPAVSLSSVATGELAAEYCDSPTITTYALPDGIEPGVGMCVPRVAAPAVVASSLPFGVKLAAAATEQTRVFVIYDDSYRSISYPMGDIEPLYGVCTDVVIRAYRTFGVDLQELVHRAKAGSGDRNIDHRRVEVLRRFFARHAEVLPNSEYGEIYEPGDIVTYYRPQNRNSKSHIAMVANERGPSGNYMIVHNRGWGPQLEDALFVDEITGHFRFSALPVATATKLRLVKAPGTEARRRPSKDIIQTSYSPESE